jgi:hypothetical protein
VVAFDVMSRDLKGEGVLSMIFRCLDRRWEGKTLLNGDVLLLNGYVSHLFVKIMLICKCWQ